MTTTKTRPAKLSPNMASALKLTLQAEIGFSRTDQSVARSGIIESWMVPTNTHAALIDRNMLTPMRMVYGGERDDQGYPLQAFGPLVQITAAGCEAIGRSMDEIIAWAWDEAAKEYAARTPDNRYLPTLPIEVGSVVGWTHRGEPMTGEVRGIFGDAATIFGADQSGWTVSLDEIERVIETAREVPIASEPTIVDLIKAYGRAKYDQGGAFHSGATIRIVSDYMIEADKLLSEIIDRLDNSPKIP